MKIPLEPCPQCTSRECGPLRCRFSLTEHRDYKLVKDFWRGEELEDFDPFDDDKEEP